MRIQTLPPGEIDGAIALWHEAGLTRPWNDPGEDLRRALQGPASTVLVGFEADRLVATAMVGHDGHRGWVYYVAVAATARRAGHGRAMMAACEEWLAERGIVKLNLMVRVDNAVARGFYEALDYAPDDVIVLSHRLR